MIEIEKKYEFRGLEPEVDMWQGGSSQDEHTKVDKVARLGEKKELTGNGFVEKQNFFFAPKEGLNLLRVFEPWKTHMNKGKLTGKTGTTYYAVFDAFLDYCEQRRIGAPQKLKLQLPDRMCLPEYINELELNNVPKDSIGVCAFVYVVGKRFYFVKFLEETTYKELLRFARNGKIVDILKKFPELRKELSRMKKQKKPKSF